MEQQVFQNGNDFGQARTHYQQIFNTKNHQYDNIHLSLGEYFTPEPNKLPAKSSTNTRGIFRERQARQNRRTPETPKMVGFTSCCLAAAAMLNMLLVATPKTHPRDGWRFMENSSVNEWCPWSTSILSETDRRCKYKRRFPDFWCMETMYAPHWLRLWIDENAEHVVEI